MPVIDRRADSSFQDSKILELGSWGDSVNSPQTRGAKSPKWNADLPRRTVLANHTAMLQVASDFIQDLVLMSQTR